MTILYVLLPLALLCGAGAVFAFVWAVESGQLDDLETPPLRILGDDDVSGATRKVDSSNHLTSRDHLEAPVPSRTGSFRRTP